MLKNIVILSCIGGVALAASAADNNKDYYFQINTGYAKADSAGTDEFPVGAMGDNALIGGELGYKFNDNFRGSLSLDYISSFSNKRRSSETDEDGTYFSENAIGVSSYAAMINLYYDIAKVNNFVPYVTIGSGMSINRTGDHYVVTSNDEDNDVITTIDGPATKRNFAYKIGLGSRYILSNSFDLDLRYQYINLGEFRTSSNQSTYRNGVYHKHSSSAIEKGNLSAHEVVLGLSYKF